MVGINKSANWSLFLYPLPMRSAYEVLAETTIACLLIVLGVSGNGVVCYTIHRSRYTKSSMYQFMVHLAYADLLVCCVSIPLTLLSTRPQPLLTSLGRVPCKLIRFLQYILPPASVAILAATSVDRYYSICHPFKLVMTIRRANLIAIGCWFFAFLLTLPIFYLIETREVAFENRICLYCAIRETATYPLCGKIYLILRGAVGFVVPLILIVVMYYRVMRTALRRKYTKRTFSAFQKQKLNVVKTLLIVVIAFNISWLPFSITNKYYLMMGTGYYNIDRLEIITFWIGLSASVYNPFIYSFYNKKFRKALKETLLRKSSMWSKQNRLSAAKPRNSVATLNLNTTLTNHNSTPSKSFRGFWRRIQKFDFNLTQDRRQENRHASQEFYRKQNTETT